MSSKIGDILIVHFLVRPGLRGKQGVHVIYITCTYSIPFITMIR